MNEGDLIVSNIAFIFILPVLSIVGCGLYLIYKGHWKLFLVFLVLIALVIGHFILIYYMNSDPLILPDVIRSYGEWFLKRN
jgi:hypothetical protein